MRGTAIVGSGVRPVTEKKHSSAAVRAATEADYSADSGRCLHQTRARDGVRKMQVLRHYASFLNLMEGHCGGLRDGRHEG
jgi:hypothetical protein